MKHAHLILAACASILLANSSYAVLDGTLSVPDGNGNPITGSQLRMWMNDLVPPNVKGLLILTECYGGNVAANFTGADNNTAVISATSGGQTATYGGYDSGASNALAPGAANTGQTVHAGGTATRDTANETPTTAGGLAPNGFSLAPVGTNDIESRHILIYAGIPDNQAGRDFDQRDKIKMNFAGQAPPGTTITTVGDAGMNGWDKPASAAELRKAIKEIGDTIAGSANPSKEQFVMFVTDHGDLHNKEVVGATVAPSTSTGLTGVPSFGLSLPGSPAPLQLLDDPNNVPGFSMFIDLYTMGLTTPNTGGGFFDPGDWELTLTPDMGAPFMIDSFFDVFTELSIDGFDGSSSIVGDTPGEGIRVYFPFDGLGGRPSESIFAGSFFDIFYDVDIANFTPQGPGIHSGSYLISEFSQDTGNISKLEPIPEPGTALWGLVGLAAGLIRRRRC